MIFRDDSIIQDGRHFQYTKEKTDITIPEFSIHLKNDTTIANVRDNIISDITQYQNDARRATITVITELKI